MKRKVVILAPTGMLGSMVYNVLQNKYRLVLVYRNAKKLTLLDKAYGGVKKHRKVSFDLSDLYQDYTEGFPKDTIGPRTSKLIKKIGKVDAIINCAGVTKPHSLTNPEQTFFINGVIPHIFSNIYKDKLIHITTDCVYDGVKGAPYDEDAAKNPNDLYGFSKSLGEPGESLVLRTSIIGPEIGKGELLIEWLKKQKGKKVKGFTNHLWNGITTKQFALICDTIISSRSAFPKAGIFHVFSSSVTKYDMLVALSKKYNVDVVVEKFKASPVDRRLSTKYDLQKKLQIPVFDQMIHEL